MRAKATRRSRTIAQHVEISTKCTWCGGALCGNRPIEYFNAAICSTLTVILFEAIESIDAFVSNAERKIIANLKN